MPIFKKAGMPGGESTADSLPMAFAAKRATSKKRPVAPGSSSNLASDSQEHYSSIADAILRQKKSSDSGEVDINENAQESGQTPYDEDNHEAYMKEIYDNDQLSDQPEDSNQKSDMFGSIKRKRR